MRAHPILLVSALAAVVAGCGNPMLYRRYQVERDFWHAQRQVRSLNLSPRGASPSQYRAAEKAFQKIVTRFPAAEWTRAPRLADPYAREVAVLSGRAAVAVARLAELQGRIEEALSGYARAENEYAAVLPVAIEAALARARAFERSGRPAEAGRAWAGLIARFPLVDPSDGQPIESVMDAPLRAADYALAEGRAASRDSILADAVRRYRAALGGQRGRAAAVPLLEHLANAEQRRGRAQEATGAWRELLREPALGARAHEVVYALGMTWLGAGRPDSARVYATWLARQWPQQAGAQALMLRAQSLEAGGEGEAALQAYQEYLDRYSKSEGGCAYALQRRSAIFEAQGRWELARTELRALAARFPSSEPAMEALLRICAHEMTVGDTALGRSEARHSIERLGQLAEQFHGTMVEMLARRTQADLFLMISDWRSGVQALTEVWTRYRPSPASEEAAIRAAQVAETRLGDPQRARKLYEDLSRDAISERSRALARAQVRRLQGGGG